MPQKHKWKKWGACEFDLECYDLRKSERFVLRKRIYLKVMKRLYHIFLALVLLAASCTPHDIDEYGNKLIHATLPEQLPTKVSLSEKGDDAGLALSWKQSDRLIVAGESVETYKLTAVEGKKATFKGKKVEGSVFDVILSNAENYESRSYLTQRQTGVNSTDHLEYDACLKGVNTYEDVMFTSKWAAEHGGELLQSGCLLLNFQLPVTASKVTRVRVEASSPIFYVTNSESSSKSSVMTLDILKGTVGVDKTVKAYFMTSMQESEIETGIVLKVIVETDKGSFGKAVVPGRMNITPGKKTVIRLDSKNWTTVQETKSFIFMSYNVGKFQKYKDEVGHYSYAEVASIIRQCGADIVGLNEIIDSQIQKLSTEMDSGWNFYFTPAVGYDNGNAIMASSDLKEVRRVKIDLPCVTEGYQTRSLGVIEYEDFVFCVTHLDHHNRTNRVPQIKQINDWVKANYGTSDKLIVLVGDMNAVPTSSEIKDDFAAYWKVVSNMDGMTYPTSGAEKCIDYIFVWKNDAVEYTINKSEVVTFCPGVDVSLASDHYPVYTEISFRKRD